MNKIKNWLNRKMGILALAMSNVEKDVLTSKSLKTEADTTHTLNVEQGTLADDLKRGILSVAVQELRWRMYETINHIQNYQSVLTGHLPDGTPIYENKLITPDLIKKMLSNIRLDNIDNYPLEFVIDNSPITMSTIDTLNIEITGESSKTTNEQGEEIITYGNVKDEGINFKPERPIKIKREYLQKFLLEDYVKKLHVRNINDNEKLLEFVFSKYPDEFDKRSTLFISELKKVLNNPRNGIVDIKEVGFITYKALGVKDLLEYQYEILNFDKIIEFEGTYIIKFKAKPIVNGVSIIGDYSGGKLEQKYKNKEARKTNI